MEKLSNGDSISIIELFLHHSCAFFIDKIFVIKQFAPFAPFFADFIFKIHFSKLLLKKNHTNDVKSKIINELSINFKQK
jgi:hypothetical protein